MTNFQPEKPVTTQIPENLPVYPIGIAAQILAISIPTLRMYEREGLVIPFRKESNQRLYSQADINRLTCIRNAISEGKMSINGIKMVYSMIPCWTIVQCTEEDREHCKAYQDSDRPCWSHKHEGNICARQDCKVCPVYTNFTECHTIKNSIKEATRK